MPARLLVPERARAGEVVAVRVLIQHPMETGFSHDMAGALIARNVIHTLIARYAGQEVFRAEMGSGIAANPMLQFWTIARASGAITLEWVDDRGVRGSVSASIVVEP